MTTTDVEPFTLNGVRYTLNTATLHTILLTDTEDALGRPRIVVNMDNPTSPVAILARTVTVEVTSTPGDESVVVSGPLWSPGGTGDTESVQYDVDTFGLMPKWIWDIAVQYLPNR